MEIYKQREYDVRNIIDDISGLSGLFENYVEEVNKFIDYLLEDTKEINILRKELQRKDSIHDKAMNNIMNIFRDENWYENYDYEDLVIALKDTLGILRGDKE